MRHFSKVAGSRVYLSPVNPEDFETFAKWMSDPNVTQFYSSPSAVFSQPSAKKFLEERAAGGCNFSIVRAKDDMLIGYVDLHDIQDISRSAYLGIFIGETAIWSQGYGGEAVRLICGFGFNSLNLHNLALTVHSDNENAISCFKKAGFREFGRRRESVFKNGKYYDTIFMEILENEFRTLK